MGKNIGYAIAYDRDPKFLEQHGDLAESAWGDVRRLKAAVEAMLIDPPKGIIPNSDSVASGRYRLVIEYARDELTGDERDVLRAVVESESALALSDKNAVRPTRKQVGENLHWCDIESSWKSLRTRVNRKLKQAQIPFKLSESRGSLHLKVSRKKGVAKG